MRPAPPFQASNGLLAHPHTHRHVDTDPHTGTARDAGARIRAGADGFAQLSVPAGRTFGGGASRTDPGTDPDPGVGAAALVLGGRERLTTRIIAPFGHPLRMIGDSRVGLCAGAHLSAPTRP